MFEEVEHEKENLIAQYTIPWEKQFAFDKGLSPKGKQNSRYAYFIGPLKFATKGKAKEFVSLWLKHSYDGYEVQEKDKQWIYALLENHPDKNERIQYHNGKIIIKRNRDNPKLFFNFMLGKTEYNKVYYEPFSYLKCFHGCLSNNHAHNCKDAFRNAVGDQVYNFRMNTFNNNKNVMCPFTGVFLTNDRSTHIDHNPKRFIDILNEFLALYFVVFDNVQLSYDGRDYHLADLNLKNSWQKYHLDTACLIAVSKIWNLTHNQENSYKEK